MIYQMQVNYCLNCFSPQVSHHGRWSVCCEKRLLPLPRDIWHRDGSVGRREPGVLFQGKKLCHFCVCTFMYIHICKLLSLWKIGCLHADMIYAPSHNAKHKALKKWPYLVYIYQDLHYIMLLIPCQNHPERIITKQPVKTSQRAWYFNCSEESEHPLSLNNHNIPKGRDQKQPLCFQVLQQQGCALCCLIKWLNHGWEANQILVMMLLTSLRFGSVGAAWRSTHAPMWAMCSLKRPLTRGAKPWQTAWELLRSGWTNSKTSTTIETPTRDWWVCTDGVPVHVCMCSWCQTQPNLFFAQAFWFI